MSEFYLNQLPSCIWMGLPSSAYFKWYFRIQCCTKMLYFRENKVLIIMHTGTLYVMCKRCIGNIAHTFSLMPCKHDIIICSSWDMPFNLLWWWSVDVRKFNEFDWFSASHIFLWWCLIDDLWMIICSLSLKSVIYI